MNEWAAFLANERLEKLALWSDTMVLLDLVQELAKRGKPRRKPYKERIASRVLVVNTAMDLGIDLCAIKRPNGSMAMGRGLLDVWDREYTRRFGSSYGTNAWLELKRRRVVTKLAKVYDAERLLHRQDNDPKTEPGTGSG